jgi:hypothetical protein
MTVAPALAGQNPIQLRLIDLWERCAGQHPVDRALAVIGAFSGAGQDECARASVGARDAILLRIYERLFGGSLDAFAECPACGERLEYSLSIRDLLAADSDVDLACEITLETGDVWLRMRLPNSLDLAAAAQCPDADAGRDVLMQRCLLEARSGAVQIPVSQLSSLSSSVIEMAEDRLAQADPMAELSIDLKCLGCGHGWQVLLDIESFLWAKLAALAKRLLREVHVLARAYGWSESDILSMTPVRREAYLQMVN